MIKIKKVNEEYIFDEVPNPVYQTSKISEIKEKILNIDQTEENEEKEENEDVDKFELLVEVL
jgi:hypothetical protein